MILLPSWRCTCGLVLSSIVKKQSTAYQRSFCLSMRRRKRRRHRGDCFLWRGGQGFLSVCPVRVSNLIKKKKLKVQYLKSYFSIEYVHTLLISLSLQTAGTSSCVVTCTRRVASWLQMMTACQILSQRWSSLLSARSPGYVSLPYLKVPVFLTQKDLRCICVTLHRCCRTPSRPPGVSVC